MDMTNNATVLIECSVEVLTCVAEAVGVVATCEGESGARHNSN